MKSSKCIWKIFAAVLAVAGIAALIVSQLDNIRALLDRCPCCHREEDESDWFI